MRSLATQAANVHLVKLVRKFRDAAVIPDGFADTAVFLARASVVHGSLVRKGFIRAATIREKVAGERSAPGDALGGGVGQTEESGKPTRVEEKERGVSETDNAGKESQDESACSGGASDSDGN